MRVKWLHGAMRDLDAEATHLALEDAAMASKMYAHIRSRVARLGQFPQLGRPGRIFGTRELIIENFPYIVPYRVKGDSVEILRIFHTSRKPPQAW